MSETVSHFLVVMYWLVALLALVWAWRLPRAAVGAEATAMVAREARWLVLGTIGLALLPVTRWLLGDGGRLDTAFSLSALLIASAAWLFGLIRLRQRR